MEKQQKILEAKHAFQRNEPFDPRVVRPVILESWERSKAFGVTMDTTPPRIISADELRERCCARKDYCEVALPFVENLKEFAAGSGFVMVVTDEDGYILQITGDEDVRNLVAEGGMVVGCNRSERRMGTNGLGTPLETGKPIQVFSEEHYFGPSRKWGCSGAPVFSPNGKIAGVFCLISAYEKVLSQNLAFAVSVAENILRQMKMKEAYNELSRTQRNLNVIIEAWPFGILLLNQKLKVIQANPRAAKLLLAENDDLTGMSFQQLIGPKNLRDVDIRLGVTDRQISIERSGLTSNLSFSIQKAAEGTYMVSFEPAETLHKKVNRIIGSEARFTFSDIIGSSSAIQSTIELARVAAENNASVMLCGESGTGKELFAQAIHNASRRRKGPFVAINCGALPKSLIESELFGYEGGSFTGAKRDGRAGKFELASGGTIFLDEIGDMPFDVQVNLLRVLQTQEVSRIGSSTTIKVDVRVISATNQNLSEALSRNEFRRDLYYRLNVFEVHIPPLRDRKEDVSLLADYFFQKYTSELPEYKATGFSAEAYGILQRYNWPGNVRELENVVERGVYLAKSKLIGPECFPQQILSSILNHHENSDSRWDSSAPVLVSRDNLNQTLSDHSIRENERRQIINTLSLCEGNVTKAASILGINRRTIYRKIQLYKIDFVSFRND
ncbi:Acetoin dehydrogenase operon transcriptional activator AcoR [bioreactor metagenome]|uniref:Acetoin dehydrogenase operon transcriptional activator AcoR n=1 Tax=bioreactor metagenome TaxID=1076179 RepID=A0A644WBB4_9ZZZZ